MVGRALFVHLAPIREILLIAKIFVGRNDGGKAFRFRGTQKFTVL